MANIKDLKKKIRSTKSTLKITTAMKLVSAAKLNRAQQAITNSRPYANELEETIRTISALATDYNHSYLKENAENKQSALVVFSASKGLCGGYNSQLVKAVRKFLAETEYDFKVFFIGKKAKELIEKEVNFGDYYTFEKNEPSFVEIQKVSRGLAEQFSSGEFGRIFVAYNVFNSAISFTPTIKKVLPMSLEESEKEKLTQNFPFDFKYDPSPNQILDALIPETFTSSFYTCLLDATAAEHGSRMAAMDNATKNCKEAIRSQTLVMNKLRQAAITTELIEVVSGAESLKG